MKNTSHKKIRIGIIGGNFGTSMHLPAFRLDSRCEVVGIAASTQARAQGLSQQFDILRGYSTWKELVQDKEIDAVSIAVPPFLQPEIAKAALKEGKAVFAEKPLGSSMKEVQELYDLANASHLPNMLNFHHTALDTWIKAKKIIQEGGIGRLQHIVIQYAGETPIPILENSWKAEKGPGRGALFDVLSHMFYHLEWFGGPLVALNAKLFSTLQNDPSKDTFDVVMAEFASGAAASITVSRTTILGSGHKVELSGEKGTLLIEALPEDLRNFRLLQGLRGDSQLKVLAATSASENDKTASVRTAAVGKLVGRFLDWMEGAASQSPSFAEGLRVHQLLESASISDATGQWVKVR